MNVLALPELAPFVIVFGVLLVIGAIELAALVTGASLTHWLDGMLSADPPDGVLGWLHLGRAPVLVLLAVLLTSFAAFGIAFNVVAYRLFAQPLPMLFSVPAAFVLALPVVRASGSAAMRLVPREESYAVTFDSLVGRVATMLGHARRAYAAEAKTADGQGHTMYLMVEPEDPETRLEAGSQVLLVRQINGNRFAAIPNPRPDLLG